MVETIVAFPLSLLEHCEIRKRICVACHQYFTKLDIEQERWAISFLNEDIDWTNFPLAQSQGYLKLKIELVHDYWCWTKKLNKYLSENTFN